MPIWKDKSGLHQQVSDPTIVEEKINQLERLQYCRQSMKSWESEHAAIVEGRKIIMELEENGMTVSVDRFRPGFFQVD
jgi:hypothetical protein